MRRPVGVKRVLSFFRRTSFVLPPSGHLFAMLPSALSRSDSFRSVHVGRSRFSRCCHLFGALWFCSCRVEPGSGHRRSHRNSALGCVFSLPRNGFDFVFAFLFYAAVATVVGRLLCNGSYTSPLTHT